MISHQNNISESKGCHTISSYLYIGFCKFGLNKNTKHLKFRIKSCETFTAFYPEIFPQVPAIRGMGIKLVAKLDKGTLNVKVSH